MNLTTSELTQIKDLKDKASRLTIQLGQVEIQMIDLELQKDELTDNYITLKGEETNLIKDIETKYGKGSINLETGEFIKLT